MVDTIISKVAFLFFLAHSFICFKFIKILKHFYFYIGGAIHDIIYSSVFNFSMEWIGIVPYLIILR